VKEAIATLGGLSVTEIGDNAHFANDLGLDSLMIIEAAVELDREFQIKGVSSDAEEPFASVDDAVRYIHDRVKLQSI
jgi:acyl carrier protein